jgi:hypothetical protein
VVYAGAGGRLPQPGAVLGQEVRDGAAVVRGAFPVHDAAGRRIGAVFVQHDVTAMDVAFRAAHARGGWIALGVALLLCAPLALVLDRLAFGPLARSQDSAARGMESQEPAKSRSGGAG